MNPRHAQALELRRRGLTFAAIGARMGISKPRARQIAERALALERRRDTWGDLSTRAITVIRRARPDGWTKADMRPLDRAYWLSFKGCGLNTLAEIQRWLEA